MLSKEEKQRLTVMALTCLRKPGETRDIFSPDVPTDEELEIIKKAIKTGDIDERLLKKLFPMAYKGVVENGFMKYFFVVHNQLIRTVGIYTDTGLVDWCTAYPGDIIRKKGSKWVVKRINGKELITDSECYPGIKAVDDEKLQAGLHVIIHRDKIHLVLNEKEYEEAVKLYEESKSKSLES